jgi:hypothetical protein
MQALDAGQLISRLNEEALSKSDPRLRRIKTCLDEVTISTRGSTLLPSSLSLEHEHSPTGHSVGIDALQTA